MGVSHEVRIAQMWSHLIVQTQSVSFIFFLNILKKLSATVPDKTQAKFSKNFTTEETL